jgi:hypothetical protein
MQAGSRSSGEAVTVLELGACFCGQPATRTLAAVPYCDPCAEVVLAPIRERHPSNGQQVGPLRPDYGPGWAELGCTTCGATWVGYIGEPCSWCLERLDEPRRERLRLAPPPSLNGDQEATWETIEDEPEPLAVELIDWATIHDRPDEIVDGLILPGRWTALAAKAKAGKTTLEMACSVAISEGVDPFDGRPIVPVTVLYVDAEMGRLDLADKLAELGYPDPGALTRWHATDLPPRLDTPAGGDMLVQATRQLGAKVVVIDGINGTVSGAEKDDLVWRAFYDHTIYPLKRLGVAILTGDNLGKDTTLGPRGSSVKVDKPDGVILLSRTDDGVKLTTRERRTSAYPSERILTIDGLDGVGPTRYRHVAHAWPPGTSDAVGILDRLGVPVDWGRGRARQALAAAGETMADAVLNAAIRWRHLHSDDQMEI